MARTSTGIQKVHFHTDWMDVPVLLDIAGVAVVLGLQYAAVRKAMQEGRIPGVRVAGTTWRVRKDQLMAHLGYADWEIERYGYGMATPAKQRGYNPVIQDDFSTALHRKEEAGNGENTSSTASGPPSPQGEGRKRTGGVVDLNEIEVMAG